MREETGKVAYAVSLNRRRGSHPISILITNRPLPHWQLCGTGQCIPRQAQWQNIHTPRLVPRVIEHLNFILQTNTPRHRSPPRCLGRVGMTTLTKPFKLQLPSSVHPNLHRKHLFSRIIWLSVHFLPHIIISLELARN